MYSVSAMLDEFLKISAAQVNPEVRKQKIIAGAKGYGTTTAAGLAGMAGSKGLEHVMLRQQAKAGPASKRQLGELYRSMGAKRVKITRAPVGEHFNPATRTISLRPRTSAAVAAHELGHATGRNVPLKAYGVSKRVVYGGAPMLANVFLDPESRAAKAMPWVGAAGSLPVLAEEGRATWRAMKALRRAGLSRWTGVKQLAPAFGTYLLGAAVPAVGAELVRRVKLRHYKKHGLLKKRMADKAAERAAKKSAQVAAAPAPAVA